MKRQRLGIIDLGTNSVRFDVHEFGPGDESRCLHREKLMVRLGENVFLTRRLEPAAIRRTLQAFETFRKTAADLKVDRIVAFGTSALRDARDTPDFLRDLKNTTGIDLTVISGEEEAKLIAEGILANHSPMRNIFGLIDIGGGSTEISLCQGKKCLASASFPLGVARLQQVFLKSIPPVPSDQTAGVIPMRRHIRSLLEEARVKNGWPRAARAIGSSGSIRALVRLARRDAGEKGITRPTLKRFIKQMRKMTLEELNSIPGMEPKRADLILAGAIVLDECMRVLRTRKVYATELSLRDGILEEQRRLFPKTKKAQAKDLAPLFRRAKSFGCDVPRLKGLVETAGCLFDRLKPLHRLPNEYRDILLAGVILRDVGRAISPIGHGSHSYYIVKHIELPFYLPWQSEMVALLCLHHEGGKKGELPMVELDSPERTKTFHQLLALLRVVDALDPAPLKQVAAKRVRLFRGKVLLSVVRSRSLELVLLRIQEKKALFEKVFSRPLSVRAAV